LLVSFGPIFGCQIVGSTVMEIFTISIEIKSEVVEVNSTKQFRGYTNIDEALSRFTACCQESVVEISLVVIFRKVCVFSRSRDIITLVE
jgi:hypothetical protein